MLDRSAGAHVPVALPKAQRACVPRERWSRLGAGCPLASSVPVCRAVPHQRNRKLAPPRETHAQEWLRRTMTVSTSSRSNQPREMYSPSLRRADTRVAKEEGTHGRP